jgi:aryl-alcohol dehydrogenase-like predicted oxidoreductase
MRYKIFGRHTGVRVAELALGTGNFGTGWGHGAEREEAKNIFDGYVEAGGNFIDTADGYQNGQAEMLVGEFIAAERDYFVLATKYALGVTANEDLSRSRVFRSNTVSSSGPRIANCCLWPRRWGWARRCGHLSVAAS